jgi:purine-binding chemotaxis protein CheW
VSLCTVRTGGETFGIDTAAVREALSQCVLHKVPLAPKFVAGVVAHRGDILLAVSLRALLGRPSDARETNAVVLEDAESGELFALLTDELLDVAQVETSSWEPNPQTLDRTRSELYHGVYKTAGAPLVRLETSDVQPSWLMRHQAVMGVAA